MSVVCSPGPGTEGAFVQTQMRDTRNKNLGLCFLRWQTCFSHHQHQAAKIWFMTAEGFADANVFTCLQISNNNSCRGVCSATRRVERVARARMETQYLGQLRTEKAEMSFLAGLGYLLAQWSSFPGYWAVHWVKLALRTGNSFCLTPPPVVHDPHRAQSKPS